MISILRSTREMKMQTCILLLTSIVAASTTVFAQELEVGRKVFAQCRACHQVGPEAKNGVGPILNGLFGRKAGSIEGYQYSDANRNSGVTWDEPTFARYIVDPRKFIPGTKMVFPGLKKESDIAAVTAYLKSFDRSGSQTQ